MAQNQGVIVTMVRTIKSIYIQLIETIVLSACILDKSIKLLLFRNWLID